MWQHNRTVALRNQLHCENKRIAKQTKARHASFHRDRDKMPLAIAIRFAYDSAATPAGISGKFAQFVVLRDFLTGLSSYLNALPSLNNASNASLVLAFIVIVFQELRFFTNANVASFVHFIRKK